MKKIYAISSVAFSGFLVYIFNKIWGDSIDWEKIRKLEIGKWFSFEIRIKIAVLFIIIVLSITIYLIISRFNKKITIYSRKQRKLQKFNEFRDEQNGLLFRWGVYFEYSGEPFISELTAFCIKHEGPPLRLVDNRWGSLFCTYPDCKTKIEKEGARVVQNAIESDLIDRWVKIK